MGPTLENLQQLGCDLLRAVALAALLLVAGLSPSPLRADEIKIGGTGSALGTMKLLADAYHKAQSETRIVLVHNLGSSGGIKAVLSGAIHLAVSSRGLREGEVGQGAKSIAYGRTPFVFVTSTKTLGISGITTEQLPDLYTGKMERWPNGTRIRLVLRPENDSDTMLVRAISPAVREAEMAAQKRPGLLVGSTDHDAIQLVEKLPGSLGTSTLALLLTERPQVVALGLNGVEPSAHSIANGSYPLSKNMLFVTTAATPPSAYKFIEFVQSPAGRAILARTGHHVN